MEKETIFGVPIDEIRRQLQAKPDYDVDPEYKLKPINPVETLEPCLRGAQKILVDPELKAMM